MIEAITSGVTVAITAAGKVVTALLGETGELKDLLPVIGMAVGIGLTGWGIRTVKSLTWGF